jgi:hypothetical protein
VKSADSATMEKANKGPSRNPDGTNSNKEVATTPSVNTVDIAMS